MQDYDAEQLAKAKRGRNLAIALSVGAFALLVFIITMTKYTSGS